MKRQAGGTSPGTDPAAGITETGGAAAGAGPTGYTSVDDPGAGGAELLEDRTLRLSGGGLGRRFGMSVPGAVVGSFLVAALAFGAAIGPLASDPAGHDGADSDTAYSEPTKAVDNDDQPDKPASVDEPAKTDDATEPDKTEASDATAKPEPTEAPAPAEQELEIALAIEGTAVVVEWSACEVDGFVAYKIVRSKDEYVKWPLGSGDSLAGVVEDEGTTRYVDKGADGGRTYQYRVFGLRSWNGETIVGCRSDAASIATPAPTPKPKPIDGDGAAMSISVVIKEGHPFIDWSACGVDFDYYKVVRSSDSTVTWPVGDNDQKVAAVGVDGETKAWDSNAPGGTKVYYRVFCIRETESGSVAVAATAVKGIQTPETEPAPDPVALGFEVDVTGEGVVLHWEGCSSDVFAFYKVVRSFTNDNPSYLPGTDGTQVIGVIENRNTTQLTDGAVESGDTIYYRVQAIGYWYGSKILLGQTAVIAVTIP
ncbi:MAG: hypothetical protein AB1736_02375 [Chloroflexota bacterium]